LEGKYQNKKGDLVDGTVTRVASFGAFVDIGKDRRFSSSIRYAKLES